MSRLGEFLEFIRQSQLRFYQERDLGLDLCHAGLPGVLVFVLAIATGTVFLLSIFHVIPQKRHVALLLLGLGGLAALAGLLTTYIHFQYLTTLEPRLIRATAGPAPVTDAQKAAVVSLPLVLGALTLAASTLGCLYMAVFWSTGLAGKQKPGK